MAPAKGPTAHTVRVSGQRPTPSQLARELRDVAVAAPLALTAPLLRPWHSRWGATAEEIAMPMPGDGLVPGCQVTWTRAITIDASPEAVWPWLAQVGFGKAGFYSNDLLDNVGHPSADRIDPHEAGGHLLPLGIARQRGPGPRPDDHFARAGAPLGSGYAVDCVAQHAVVLRMRVAGADKRHPAALDADMQMHGELTDTRHGANIAM